MGLRGKTSSVGSPTLAAECKLDSLTHGSALGAGKAACSFWALRSPKGHCYWKVTFQRFHSFLEPSTPGWIGRGIYNDSPSATHRDRVLIHQRHSICKMAYQTPLHPCSACIQVPSRHFAAARKPEKKTKKSTKGKTSDEKKDEIEKIKSYPFMEGEPEDDVYLKRLYPRQIYEVEKAIHLLKKFQILDFTNPAQGVYLDLTLDMALGKKKKVEPFASVLRLPYPFVSEINRVAVFTGSALEIKIAEENGAAFAGGTDLIQKILNDEIQSDFYVAVPEIMPELNPLRKKLKKRFPKLTRNSIGRDIPKMLELFKTGHEIKVDEERENFLETKIATLNMSSDEIAANLQAVIGEVCRHRPLDLGPFVIRAFLRSSTSEGLLLKIEPLLPKEVETKESNKEAA